MFAHRMAVTGGAGFVGSNLSVLFKTRYPNIDVIVLDNLKRRGSELNLSRLAEHGIRFIHGDIRNKEDLHPLSDVDLIIECSAEPSVLAGYNGDPSYLLNTNLLGTINCLESAKANKAIFVFLSTSRVYPFSRINQIRATEDATRFRWVEDQYIPGWSGKGITTDFSLDGSKTLYGASKLCSELLIQEYVDMFGLRAIINRCGLLAGPWQFGKVDQGVITYWMLCHYFKRGLAYIGFGGDGKQVRDLLHVADLFELLNKQLACLDKFNGSVYNVGGGTEISASLRECTEFCADITGNRLQIARNLDARPGDISIYLSDSRKTQSEFGWKPTRTPHAIFSDIFNWIRQNEDQLRAL